MFNAELLVRIYSIRFFPCRSFFVHPCTSLLSYDSYHESVMDMQRVIDGIGLIIVRVLLLHSAAREKRACRVSLRPSLPASLSAVRPLCWSDQSEEQS